MGNSELIETLMRRGLIDEYLLVIHPLVLGTGRRMFASSVPRQVLRRADSKTTAKGVVIATYETALQLKCSLVAPTAASSRAAWISSTEAAVAFASRGRTSAGAISPFVSVRFVASSRVRGRRSVRVPSTRVAAGADRVVA
jgi:hypothetical protein